MKDLDFSGIFEKVEGPNGKLPGGAEDGHVGSRARHFLGTWDYDDRVRGGHAR